MHNEVQSKSSFKSLRNVIYCANFWNSCSTSKLDIMISLRIEFYNFVRIIFRTLFGSPFSRYFNIKYRLPTKH